MSEYLIDTSAWIEYIKGSEAAIIICDLVESNEARVSILTLAELSNWLTGKQGMQRQLDFLERYAEIIPLSTSVCRNLGKLQRQQRKQRGGFGTADALIYLTAQEQHLTLLTADNDFRGLPNVELLS